MGESAMEVAKLVGTIIGAILLTLGGSKALDRTARKSESRKDEPASGSSVEEQLNLRIDEKDQEIKDLKEEVSGLRRDLELERQARADDQRRYQQQLDDLRDRFDKFRDNHRES